MTVPIHLVISLGRAFPENIIHTTPDKKMAASIAKKMNRDNGPYGPYYKAVEAKLSIVEPVP